MVYDTIVIGSGPSGISCAIYLKRFNINVLVVGLDNSPLNSNIKIENYYGFNSIEGKKLFESGINQAKSLGINVINEEVTKIEAGENFIVKTPNDEYFAKTIYLATGKKRKSLNIKGLKEFEGKGISYCAICDGFLYRNKKIALIGSGNYMKEEYEVLKRFSSNITIFSNGLSSDPLAISDKIVEFVGDENLIGIKTENDFYPVDACFIAEGNQDSISFSKHLGLLLDDNNNNILINDYQTNITGIFAGGDCVGGLLQVSKAVSDGALAANFIKKYLDTI